MITDNKTTTPARPKKASASKKQVIDITLKKASSPVDGRGLKIEADVLDFYEEQVKKFNSKMTGKCVNDCLRFVMEGIQSGTIILNKTE